MRVQQGSHSLRTYAKCLSISEKEVGITVNLNHSKGLIIKFFFVVAITNSLSYGHNFIGEKLYEPFFLVWSSFSLSSLLSCGACDVIS